MFERGLTVGAGEDDAAGERFPVVHRPRQQRARFVRGVEFYIDGPLAHLTARAAPVVDVLVEAVGTPDQAVNLIVERLAYFL